MYSLVLHRNALELFIIRKFICTQVYMQTYDRQMTVSFSVSVIPVNDSFSNYYFLAFIIFPNNVFAVFFFSLNQIFIFVILKRLLSQIIDQFILG